MTARRLATILLTALLAAGLFPAGVLAADRPVASADPVATDEDQAVTVNVTAVDASENELIVSFAVETPPAGGSLGSFSAPDCSAPPVCTAAVTYTPDPDSNGSDSFTFTALDAGGDTSLEATAEITVDQVNDAPSFTAGANRTVAEDTGAHSVPGWATQILEGPPDEVPAQSVSFVIDSNSNPGLFSAGPAVSPAGTLSFTAAANANGSATITLHLHDTGGVLNGGVDDSATQSVTITVTPVNDPPSFTKGGNQTDAEDAGAQSVNGWATAISPGGGTDEAGQALSFVIDTNSNSGLFSAAPAVSSSGTLTYTPAANANGSATITLHVADTGGGTNASPTQSFTITVTPVNDAPTPADDDVSVAEDSGNTTIDVLGNDSDLPDTGEPLSVTAVGSAAHGTTILNGGVVRYRPTANYNGPDSFTYTLSDGTLTATGTVNVTVTSVNDVPTANNDSATVAEDSSTTTIDVLANDAILPDTGETLTVTAVGAATHGSAAVTAGGGSVTYTPAANNQGADSFTYTISDGNGGTDTGTVTVTVTPVNDNPLAADDTRTIGEDAGPTTILVLANDSILPDAGETLTVTAVSTASHGTVAVTAGGGSVTYTPAANHNGSDSFTYTISDGNGGTDTATVDVTVTAVNDPPTFTQGADPVVLEDAGARTIPAWATSIFEGAANEIAQAVSFGVTDNSNPGLFAAGPTIATNGTLTFTPAADASGQATIDVVATDDGGVANGGDATSTTHTFTITVTSVNDVPSFTAGADQSVLEDAAAQSIAGWATAIDVGPASESAQDPSFEVTSNANPDLFDVLPAVAADGTLTYALAPDANGSALVGVRVHDDGGVADGGADTSASQSFTISVAPVNDPPSFTPGADVAAPEDSGLQTVTGWATDISTGPGEAGQGLSFGVTNVSDPSLFAVQPSISPSGTLTFRGASNRSGVATMDVVLADDGGMASGGTNVSPAVPLTITVAGANDSPIASNDLATVRLTGPTSIPVLGNDSGGPNEPGDTPLITAVREGSRGILTITGGGTGLTYDPTGCTTGSDTFSYTVTDRGGLTDTATVLVTIASPTTIPTTDGPAASFYTGGTLGSTVPVRESWCGLTSGTTIRSFRLGQSTNGGTFSTPISATAATSSVRTLGMSPTRYQFKARVTDNKNRTSGYAYGPVFRIVRYEDASAAIVYSSGWSKSSSSSYSGGSTRAASGTTRTATLTYTGRGFSIVGPRSSSRGSFNVYVDGAKVTATAISEKSSTTAYRRLLYSRTLPQGTHTIQIRPASSARIDLDAILTFQAP